MMDGRALLDAPYEPEDVVITRDEEYAYGYIIEVLTQGLYPNKLHAIREYVQNAYDAIRAWRRESGEVDHGQIQIKIANPSIFVYDDGIGMDYTKINQYRYVGYSEKRTGEGVGFRGIGKLSGLSAAEKLIVTSSPKGIAERYQLVFDAEAMLTHILQLKLDGQNIPLNELIRTHTTVFREPEDSGKHYTMVELHKVRADSRELMDEEKLRVYLSMNVPLDFDPQFPHGSSIDSWLREYVSDYDTVSLYLDGEQIFKPFLADITPPHKIFVWPEDVEREQTDDEEGDTQEPLAFCWYCEHTQKGQLKDKLRRGLFYRLKNFTVGTNELPRMTLWRSTPERSFYFSGEIHICHSDVVPSSSRDDFEQNEARKRLYTQGPQISRTLNRMAGKSSARRRARHFIVSAEEDVARVGNELEAGQIPQEVKFDKMFSVQSAIQEVTKRLRQAPEPFQERGRQVVGAGQELLAKLDGTPAGKQPVGVYDIKRALALGPEAARVYGIIASCLKDEFGERPEVFERLIRRIHAALAEQLAGDS